MRHLGNTLAGEAEGSLREHADRMGHSTTRAALSYQHRTSLRDKMIADEIGRRAKPSSLNRAHNRHETTVRQHDGLELRSENTSLAACSLVERVTGIEAALSAWESVPSGLDAALNTVR